MKNTPELGFDWVFDAAVFTCTQCDGTLAIKKPAPMTAPETMAVMARKKGWTVWADRKSYCLCPSCYRKPKSKNDPDSELKAFTPQLIPEVKMTVLTPAVPTPTPEQREKIRDLLEEHFDAKTGRFKNGMSDRKISEKLNTPMVIVKQIREIGYGLEQIDPEIELLRAEFSSIHERLCTAEKRLAKIAGATP